MSKLKLAKDLINNKIFDEALVILKELVKQDSENHELFFEIGKILFIKKNFNDAILNFKKSIDIKETLYANLLLSMCLKSIGKYRDALRLLSKIKKSSFEQVQNTNKEIVECLILLKRYLYAYKFFNKYMLNDFVSKQQIIEGLLDGLLKNKYKNISGEDFIELETFIYDFLENNDNLCKNTIELQLLQLYEKNVLVNKDKFYNYIVHRREDKNNLKHYNLILNKLEIKRQDINLLSKPISLVVTLTNACNIKCDFCRISKEKLWSLPEKKVREIVELLPYVNFVSWLGGEVFLYKGFNELFDVAVKNDVAQEIITNGLLLDENIICKFMSARMKLSISVTNISEKSYENSHAGAKFKKLISNLNIIKNNINKRKEGFQYWMYVCVMKENIMELESIVEFAKEYNFDVLRFQPLEQLNSSFYNEDIVKYFVNKAIVKANKYNIKIDNILPIDFSNYREKYFSENQIKEEINKLCSNKKYVVETNEIKKEDVCLIDTNKTDNRGIVVEEENLNYQKYNLNVSSGNDSSLFCEYPWTTMIINYGGEITFDCSCRFFNKLDNINDKALLSVWNSEKIQIFREKIKKRNYYDICSYNCINYNVHKK